MALDFPANPVDGQIYGSYIYSLSKGVWQSREESAAVAVTSQTPPTSAKNGDIWVDTSDGVAYFYYNDGNTSQWVELMSSGVPSLALKADKTYVDSQDLLKANLSGATFTGDVSVGTSGTYMRADNGTAYIKSSQPSKTVLSVTGATSQTANLQEWQDSSGAIKTRINSAGKIYIDTASDYTTVNQNNGTGGIELKSTSTTAASMSFHVPTLIATNIGVQPDQKFSIGGWSLPADSLTLDISGRMRVPNQPSFNVTGGGAANGVSTFIYTTINHNTGNCYNSSNGRFTAPIAGTYVFEATVGNNADFYVDLSVNGNIWRRAERRNGSASIGYFWIPTVMVVKLNAGDYVSVICNYGTANSSAPYAGFSGSLIA